MKTLISMTDFVTASFNKIKKNDTDVIMEYLAICKYSLFLKQYLEKWMFVPCVNGELFNYSKHGNKEDYEQAREKVLFKGFEVEDDLLIIPNFGKQEIKNIKGLTIEALTGFEIELTPTALKQIGL